MAIPRRILAPALLAALSAGCQADLGGDESASQSAPLVTRDRAREAAMLASLVRGRGHRVAVLSAPKTHPADADKLELRLPVSHVPPAPVDVRWSVAVAGEILSPVAVGPETAYAGTDAGLAAVTLDGHLAWSVAAGAVRGKPVIAVDGTVYFTSEDGHLYAVSQQGTVLWTLSTRKGLPIRSGAAIDPLGSIVFGGDDGVLRSVAPDGRLRWELPAGAPLRAAPAIAPSGLVLAGADDGTLRAVDRDGTIRWKKGAGAAVRAAPGLSRREAFVASDDGSVNAWRLTDGEPLWSTRLGNPGTSCAPAMSGNGRLYACDGSGRLAAMNATTGAVLWQRDRAPVSGALPAHAGATGAMLFADGSVLRAVNDTGQPRWSVDVASPIAAAPTLSAQGAVLAGTADGRIVAVGPAPDSLVERCEALAGAACPCACTACPDFASACAAHPGCSALLACAATTGCRGRSCLAEPACSSALGESGGPLSRGARLAAQLAACAASRCACTGGS